MSGEITNKLTSNLQARGSSAKGLITSEVSSVKKGVANLLGVKPVPAFADIVIGTIDNMTKFIIDQAEITRRWVK